MEMCKGNFNMVRVALITAAMSVLLILSASYLVGCSEEEPEEEPAPVDLIYGAPDYGYFNAGQTEYEYLGAADNNILFVSQNGNALVQLTDLSKILKNEDGTISTFISTNQLKDVLEQLTAQITNGGYNLSSSDKTLDGAYIAKVVDADFLGSLAQTYGSQIEKAKDPVMYVVLNDKFHMMTVLADSSVAYKIAMSFLNDATPTDEIDLEQVSTVAAIEPFDYSKVAVRELVIETEEEKQDKALNPEKYKDRETKSEAESSGVQAPPAP